MAVDRTTEEEATVASLTVGRKWFMITVRKVGNMAAIQKCSSPFLFLTIIHETVKQRMQNLAWGESISRRLDGPGIVSRWRQELPHSSCGPPKLLSNGYRVSFPGVKQPGRGVNHTPPFSAEVKERVEVYFYSSGPSRHVIGWPLPFHILRRRL